MEVLSHLGSRRFYRLLVVYTVVQVYVRYLPCRRDTSFGGPSMQTKKTVYVSVAY